LTLVASGQEAVIDSIAAPCGEAAPPTPIWNQSATIQPGPDGSGNADVLFINDSNQTGGFYVTIGGGDPTSATSVAAGKTKSIPIHAEPGTVIRVYGTKDGTAPPKFLKELTLPKVAPPAPIWNQSATITVGDDGSGNASVKLTNGSNASAVYVVYYDGKELSRYTVPTNGTTNKSITGLTPGKTLAVYGIKDGSASLGSPLDSELVPVAVPPTPVWNQTAQITMGAAGSGNATVALVNGSNAPAVFAVYLDGNQLSQYTVKAGGSISKSLTGLTPGKTLAVYGIKDGSASLGTALASDTVPLAPVSTDNGDTKKVTVCHATGQDDKYVRTRPSVNSFYKEGHNSHQDKRDIYGPFTYIKHGERISEPGLNWDEAGRAIFENDCVKPDVVVSPVDDDTSKPIGVCLWVDEGKFRGYVMDTLRVGAILQGEGNTFSKHIIPPFGYAREGVKADYDGQNWTDANQELFANGCKAEVEEPPYIPNEPAEVPSTPESPEVPATSVIPRVSSTPTTPPASIAAKKAAVKDVKKTRIDRSNVTFETAASDVVTSAPIQNNGPLAAVLLAVALALIAGVIFTRRRTAK
jgi:hypothetical protein